MKSALKAVLKKILFKTNHPTAFPAVRIAVDQVKEQFLLKRGEFVEGVSDRHCIVCHKPFCIAVWLTTEDHGVTDQCEALVKTGDRLDARLSLVIIRRITEGKNELIVCQAVN